MKVLFIINPNSGKKRNDRTILRIHQHAAEKQFDFKFHYTSGKDDDRKIRQALNEYKPDRVIAGGGDGTVQLVARNMLGSEALMGLLPLGSANGMATALELTQNPVQAVDEVLNTEHFVRLDVLRFNDHHYCVHLGDIGINALMVKKYSEQKRKGMLGYARHLVSSIKESPLLNYTIETPEGNYNKEGYLLAFANGHKFGTGVRISDGEAWDGKFEICNVPKSALEKAVKAGITLLNVFVTKEMFTDVVTCTSAEVVIDRKTHFQIDGEYIGEIDRLKVEIIPSAIKLLVP